MRGLAKITIHSDTRDVLAHAAKAASKLADYFIVDIDAHIIETAFWSDITDRIDNDYIRHAAKSFREKGGSPPGRACGTDRLPSGERWSVKAEAFTSGSWSS